MGAHVCRRSLPARLPYCVALLLGLGVQLPASAQQSEVPVVLHINQQPLRDALTAFADQTGLQLVYHIDDVSAQAIAPALSGPYTPEAALAKLLETSGLSYHYVNAKTVAIRPARSGTGDREMHRDPGTTAIKAESPSAGDSGTTDASANSIQEVIVTAQKRAERLIDTPQSVSVVSAGDLAKLGATQFTDFANTVPGLDFATAGSGFTQISMRGVTTGYDVSSTVGIYVDDVPYGSSTTFALGNLFGLDPGLFDLDRIEVLLGPQGTLYGASAMGGLIKYVTRRPDLSGFGGDGQVGISSIGDGGGINYNVAAAANLPVIPDKAALRVSGYETHDGGFIENLALGKRDVNRGDTYGGRLDLLLTPVEPLSVRLTAFLQNTSRDGEATVDYNATGAMPYGRLGQLRPFPGGEPFKEEFRLVSGTVTYDFGVGTLTSISGYQTLSEANTWDVTGILGGLCTVPFETFGCSSVAAISNVDGHKFTQEIRLASKTNRLIEWQLGAFYTHETSSQYEYFALRDPAAQPRPNNLFTYYVPATYKEYAGFGDLTWHITGKIDVTGGLRYSRDDQDFSQTGAGLLGVSKPGAGSGENVRTYLGVARYHFSDRSTGYLRYSTGYRPGGPNYVTVNPVTGLPNGPATFQPDTLKNYEAGFKAESEDRRLGFDISAYHILWSNIQISTNSGGFSSIANATGGATVDGAELTVTARPIAPLTTSATFAYTHAYMRDGDVKLGADEGERLPGSPRVSGSVIADYVLSPGSWRPTVGATLRYVADRTVDFHGDRPVNVQPRLPAYTLVDIRGGLDIGATTVQLYIHNLFDNHGQLSIILPQFGDRVAIAQPRTVGVTVAAKF